MREKFVHDLPVFCDGLSVVSTVHVGIPISPPAPETFVRRRKGGMPSRIRSYLGHAQVRHQAIGILRLVLLCLAQTPALAQSTANGTANATAECRCTNVCTGAPQYAVDDECDDGGPGAGYDLCEYGSDCLDCGGPRCGNSTSLSASYSYDYEGGPPFPPLPPLDPPSPSMPPLPPGCTCNSSCVGNPQYSGDGVCDDGGPGADFNECAYATDCLDCGPDCGASPSMPPVPPGCTCNSSCVGNPEYSGDGVCDDGGPGADFNECAYATDCLDCGPDCLGLPAAPAPGAPAPSPSPLRTTSPPPSMVVEGSFPSPPWRPSGVVEAPSSLPSMAVGALAGLGILAALFGCRWCARKMPPSCYARCRPRKKGNDPLGNEPEFAGTASLVFGGRGAQMSSSDSSKWKVDEDDGL